MITSTPTLSSRTAHAWLENLKQSVVRYLGIIFDIAGAPCLKRNITLLALFLSAASSAAELPLAKEYQSLDQRIQSIKSGVLALEQDLSMLNKDTQSFSGNPLVVYLSTDIDEIFELQAIELELNGTFLLRKEMTSNVLLPLQHGGAQQIFEKDLAQGDYELKATLFGKVGKGRPYQTPVTVSFLKEKRPKIIELRVSNARERFLPTIDPLQWD